MIELAILLLALDLMAHTAVAVTLALCWRPATDWLREARRLYRERNGEWYK